MESSEGLADVGQEPLHTCILGGGNDEKCFEETPREILPLQRHYSFKAAIRLCLWRKVS